MYVPCAAHSCAISCDDCWLTRLLGQAISINMLPDKVLLEIFHFYQLISRSTFYYNEKRYIEAWQTLVHVCQRWRNVVFGSTRRLDPRLYFTPGTIRDKLTVWPPLPILISNRHMLGRRNLWKDRTEIDNVVAFLGHSDRVRLINLVDIKSSHHLEEFLAAMQEPVPQLTDLMLHGKTLVRMPVVPDSFLGGSAPCLRELSLERIPFPGLPKLLLSATNLVGLHLYFIPYSGYISPETMLATLSVLTKLRSLHLQFKSPRSRPNQESRRPSPPSRCVLPALTSLKFTGFISYLEYLVAWIDAPQLGLLFTNFFNEIEFDTPELVQFIRRTPMLKEFEKAGVSFEYRVTRVNLASITSGYRTLSVGNISTKLAGHLPSLQQVFTSSLSPLSTLESLYIFCYGYAPLDWQSYVQKMPLPELLRPFAAAKNLYLSDQIAEIIAFSMKELVGGGLTEILPNLENIFVEYLGPGPVQEDIGQFVAARQATGGHPIAIIDWDKYAENGVYVAYDGDDLDPDEYEKEDDDW
jgi:hypothetical protein